jgi:hypothetical protein
MRLRGDYPFPNHFYLLAARGRRLEQLDAVAADLSSAPRPPRYGSSGPVWQGKIKALPAVVNETDLAVLRYMERNPLGAGLVRWGLRRLGGRREELGLEDMEQIPAPVRAPVFWLRESALA